MRKQIALLCAGIVALTGAAGAVEASAAPTDGAEEALVAKINRVRAAHGLRPLVLSPGLARSAGRWSRYQLRRGYFGHAARIQASGRFRTLGEVIAMHRSPRPRLGATVGSWMRSAVHNQILMSPAFRYVGAGRAVGRFGGGGRTTVWTVQVGGF